MNPVLAAQRGIDTAIRALGRAVLSITVGQAIPATQMAGHDYEDTWKFHDGKAIWEKAEQSDFPRTMIQVTDEVLLVLKCAHEIQMHEFVYVSGSTYEVFDVKTDRVGSTRILQKLLVRKSSKVIAWESPEVSVA